MEPAFYRGDLLFLTNPASEQYKTGDITIYRTGDRNGPDIPIVHRVIETHDMPLCAPESFAFTKPTRRQPKLPAQCTDKVPRQLMLTKGDNNYADDLELYRGLDWLERKHIVGKVKGFLPYIGYVTIAMNDFPQLKYALLGGLGLLALIQRE